MSSSAEGAFYKHILHKVFKPQAGGKGGPVSPVNPSGDLVLLYKPRLADFLLIDQRNKNSVITENFTSSPLFFQCYLE